MSEPSGVTLATNTSTNRNQYQKEYAQKNREKLLARRRQLYAESEERRQKDKEYYLRIRDTPEYKQRAREAAHRWFQKHKAKNETETERRTRYRQVGKLLADRHKAKGSTRVTPVDRSWMDSIPDLKEAYGALPEPKNFVRYF